MEICHLIMFKSCTFSKRSVAVISVLQITLDLCLPPISCVSTFQFELASFIILYNSLDTRTITVRHNTKQFLIKTISFIIYFLVPHTSWGQHLWIPFSGDAGGVQTMKTYHTYFGDSQQAETKLKRAESQRVKSGESAHSGIGRHFRLRDYDKLSVKVVRIHQFSAPVFSC